jgi:hypothetical protein
MAQKKDTDPFLKKLEEGDYPSFEGTTAKPSASKAPLKKPVLPDPILDRYNSEGILGSKPGATHPEPDLSGIPELDKIVDEAMEKVKGDMADKKDIPALNSQECDSIVKGVMKKLQETDNANKAKRNPILIKVTEIRVKLNEMKEGKSLLSKISSALGGKSDVVAMKDILYAIEKVEQYVHIAKDMELIRKNPVLMSYLKEIADLGDPIATALINTK